MPPKHTNWAVMGDQPQKVQINAEWLPLRSGGASFLPAILIVNTASDNETIAAATRDEYAQLIAAAPELLRRLKEAVPAVQHSHEKGSTCWRCGADELISKAGG